MSQRLLSASHLPAAPVSFNLMQRELQSYTMDNIAHVISRYYSKPVVDGTGLTNAYDVEAKWDATLRGKAAQKEIENVLRDQLGLSLTPDRQSVEVLVIGKAK